MLQRIDGALHVGHPGIRAWAISAAGGEPGLNHPRGTVCTLWRVTFFVQ